MARLPGDEPLYHAAERFVEEGLRRDGSLFTPGKAVWTLDPIDDFYQRFVVNEDNSADSFEVKLRRQLAGAEQITIQFVAELLYVYLLIPHNMTAATKRTQVRGVLGLLAEPVAIPDDLDSAFACGIANLSAGLAQRPQHLRFLVEFLRQGKQLDDDTREQALRDPWQFKARTTDVHVKGGQVGREGLLHLVFPDTFEPMVSAPDKQLIVDRLQYLVTDPADDVDRALLQIRTALDSEAGRLNSFYDPLIRPAWDPRQGLWDRFIYWAARFYRRSDFEHEELDYKIATAEHARAAKTAFAEGQQNWLDLLKRAFGSPSNLTNYRVHDPFLKWCAAEPASAGEALRAIWTDSDALDQRLDRFLVSVPREVLRTSGARLSIASFLLLAEDPHTYAIYRAEPVEAGYRLTGYPPPDPAARDTERHLRELDFLDEVIAQGQKRGLVLRDRLDAQSVLWCVVRWEPGDWPQPELDTLAAYRAGKVPDAGTGGGDDGNGEGGGQVSGQLPELTIEGLAAQLLVSDHWLNDIRAMLEAKGQVIFYGPPGTGKTYVALEFGQYLARDGGRVEIVQFHPSYAYEDFVMGYRPQEINGRPAFKLLPGPLVRIAEEARQNPNVRFVLVIDEINRGNVARVFGELYFLLEYRDRAINLQYRDEPFQLPQNLWIIGTMNTADRSIALMDAALRRRFFFVPFFPTEPPMEGLLARWLDRNSPEMRWVADVVHLANERLGDRHVGIGPSYFMRDDLDEDWVTRIWKFQILPYLEEHFFGEPDRLTEFGLDELRAAAQQLLVAADQVRTDGPAPTE